MSKKPLFFELVTWSGNKWDSLQYASEEVWDWRIQNDHYYFESARHNIDTYLEDGLEIIAKEAGISIQEAREKWLEESTDRIVEAVGLAMGSYWESEWLRRWWDSLYEHITDSFEHYSGNIYLYDRKLEKKIILPQDVSEVWKSGMNEAEDILIYPTRDMMIKYLGDKPSDWREEPWDYVADKYIDTVLYEAREVDIEHIDYYGNIWGDDCWQEILVGDTDIVWTIKDHYKKQAEKLKSQIKHDVPMKYRSVAY